MSEKKKPPYEIKAGAKYRLILDRRSYEIPYVKWHGRDYTIFATWENRSDDGFLINSESINVIINPHQWYLQSKNFVDEQGVAIPDIWELIRFK